MFSIEEYKPVFQLLYELDKTICYVNRHMFNAISHPLNIIDLGEYRCTVFYRIDARSLKSFTYTWKHGFTCSALKEEQQLLLCTICVYIDFYMYIVH